MKQLRVHQRDLPAGCDPFESYLRLKGDAPSVLFDGRPPASERNRTAMVLFDPFDVVKLPAGSDRRSQNSNPMAGPSARLAAFTAGLDCKGTPFAGGAAGWFAYDLGRHLERLPATARSDSSVPDLWFGLFNRGLVIDLDTGEARIFVTEIERAGRSGRSYVKRAFADTLERLQAERARLPEVRGSGRLCSNFGRSDYLRAVDRVREFIRAGEVYQVNLSQRFESACEDDPLAIFGRLRAANPAPFSALVQTGETALLCSSPERFLRLCGDLVETRPIKGTRERTGDPARDEAARLDLLGSRKDAAELAMIVDLERNDLGRVARFGSVEVIESGRLEAYATVFHREALIRCQLRPGLCAPELLAACFPGGSITGAPKIRAMEVIEELEKLRRGAFTGSIGWIGFDGDLDLNIAIRTLVLESGRAHFHCGGGIVLDSDPEQEYLETLSKGRALAAALKLELTPDSIDRRRSLGYPGR